MTSPTGTAPMTTLRPGLDVSRRGVLSALIAAPIIVAVGNIMPVRSLCTCCTGNFHAAMIHFDAEGFTINWQFPSPCKLHTPAFGYAIRNNDGLISGVAFT